MNKTNLILYSLGLLLWAAVCSCQDDPATEEGDNDGGGGSEVMFALSTRAGDGEVETTFAEGTTIGIVRQSSGTVNANNYLYTYADGTFHADPGEDKILWDSGVTSITAEAFYPYNTNGYETLSVNADQSGTDDKGQSNYFLSDALHAKGSVEERRKPVQLTFYHVMSKLVLNITRANTDEAINAVILGEDNLPLSASFTYKDDGSVNGVSSRGTANASITTCPDAANNKWRAIIIPQDNATIKVTVKTNIGDYVTTLPQYTYVSGGQYTCSLSIQNAALVVTGTILPWDWDAEDKPIDGDAEIQ